MGTFSGGLERSVLADQVKERILAAILRGEYGPDSRIVETQVARELGTSQAPVREALRGLEALGVVVIEPFRGARVRRPTRREILEAYVVRSALETLAASLAVPRIAPPNMADLAGDLAAMRAAADADDGGALAEADAAFHGRIVELADNSTLLRVWRSLEPFSRTYLTLVVPGADAHWAAELHAPILAAVERRDAGALADALRDHFEQVSENMSRRLPPEDDSTPVLTVADR